MKAPHINTGLALVLAIVLAACAEPEPNAYGNFEATEVAVSAELGGPLLAFSVREGDVLEAGAIVGTVDTLDFALQRDELNVAAESSRIRRTEALAQIRILEAQLAPAREDLERLERLSAVEAATAQQLTRARGQVAVLEEQISAARIRVRLTEQEGAAVASRIGQIQNRLSRGSIANPIRGTVLRSFVEPGESVQPGRPLYTIASLDTLTLRAWVSGRQLGEVQLGQQVTVQFDATTADATSFERREGRVTWIASEAEFTPTPIQTRDERVDQVYAIKIRVANTDGRLKIGMPGELVLGTTDDGAQIP